MQVGSGQRLWRRAFRKQPALFQQDHPVREIVRERKIVNHHHDCPPIIGLRSQMSCQRCLVREVERAGHDLRFVNAGGSGSLALNATEDAVTEVTAGSAFYGPVLFGHHNDYTYYPAAGYAIPVVRRPSEDTFTCLGGGYTSSGAGGPETLPTPYLPEGARLTRFEGAGEVQTPIAYRGEESLRLGSPVFMRHAKAGELCERFEKLWLCSGGEVVEEVLTYRGQGQCFL